MFVNFDIIPATMPESPYRDEIYAWLTTYLSRRDKQLPMYTRVVQPDYLDCQLWLPRAAAITAADVSFLVPPGGFTIDPSFSIGALKLNEIVPGKVKILSAETPWGIEVDSDKVFKAAFCQYEIVCHLAYRATGGAPSRYFTLESLVDIDRIRDVIRNDIDIPGTPPQLVSSLLNGSKVVGFDICLTNSLPPRRHVAAMTISDRVDTPKETESTEPVKVYVHKCPIYDYVPFADAAANAVKLAMPIVWSTAPETMDRYRSWKNLALRTDTKMNLFDIIVGYRPGDWIEEDSMSVAGIIRAGDDTLDTSVTGEFLTRDGFRPWVQVLHIKVDDTDFIATVNTRTGELCFDGDNYSGIVGIHLTGALSVTRQMAPEADTHAIVWDTGTTKSYFQVGMPTNLFSRIKGYQPGDRISPKGLHVATYDYAYEEWELGTVRGGFLPTFDPDVYMAQIDTIGGNFSIAINCLTGDMTFPEVERHFINRFSLKGKIERASKE